MGNCTSKKKNTQLLLKFRTIGENYEFGLKFYIKLSRVKIRELSFASNSDQKIKVEFSFPFKQISFQEISKSENMYKWPQVHEFVYQSLLDEMNRQKLEISVLSKNKVICTSSIKINSIIDGPVHHNLSLISNGLVAGRISFDLEFLEETTLTIDANSLYFALEDDNIGEFSSSIKFACDFSKESSHSELSESPCWDFYDNSVSLSFLVTINKIRDAALQLRLYKHHKSDKELVAECWISFTKIFAQDLGTIYRKESYMDLRSVLSQQFDYDKVLKSLRAEHYKNINEVVWLCGRKVGKVTGLIKISGMPTFVQLSSGVNTENGITVQNVNIIGNNSKKKNLPKEIMEIQKLLNKLKKSIKFSSGKSGNAHEKELFKHKKSIIDSLCDLLKISAKESMKLYTFTNPKSLMKSQEILIDLVNYLVEYAPIVEYDIKPYYFEAIILLIDRGELDIGHLILENLTKDLIGKKVKIAVEYYKMLHEVLTLTISRMVYKGVDSSTQQYIDKSLVISWFRVPEFRNILKETLKKKSYYAIEELGTTEEDEDLTHIISNPLDWDAFHSLIPEDFKNESFLAACQELEWRSRLEKRGISFFSFFAEWIDHVSKQTISNHLVWSCIPGYKMLVKVFLIEMKERNTIEYPEALVLCANKLVCDSRMFNVMIRLLFGKTNVYDFHAVQEMFKVLNSLFSAYFLNKRHLPSNFEADYFDRGISICLKDDNAMNIANCIWFLYNQYQLMQGNLKKSIFLDCLIGSLFKKFFYHWSKDVRNMFFHLICYRVLSLKYLVIDSEIDNEINKMVLEKLEEKIGNQKIEKLRSLQAPYFHTAQAEFNKVRDEFDVWVKKLPNERGKIFSVSDGFPYPVISPKLNFIDLAERRLEEKW